MVQPRTQIISSKTGNDNSFGAQDSYDLDCLHLEANQVQATPAARDLEAQALGDEPWASNEGGDNSRTENACAKAGIGSTEGQEVLRETKQENPLDEDSMINYPEGVRLLTMTLGIMAYVLMVALDNYILATAIPHIASQFNSLDAVRWYASSYFLTQMAIQPAFGRLFDEFSAKRTFILAMGIFEVGSILCALAPSSSVLIGGRLIAGAGAAGLYVGTLILISHAVPIRKRPFYLSVVTSMFGVASFAGPLLGGVFTDSKRLTWRFCFWINLPIGFIAILLIGIFYQPPDRSKTEARSIRLFLIRLDLPGVLLLVSAFVCLTLGLQWAAIVHPWSDSRVWGCILGFCLLLSTFVAEQIWMGDEASIPWRIVSQRTVAAGSFFLLFVQAIVGTLISYLPLYFQAVQGTDARGSAVANLPFLITLLFAPMASGILISFYGPYVPYMWIGAVLATIGSGLLLSLGTNSSHGAVDAYQFVAGLGLGLCNQIPFNAVQHKLPKEKLVLGSTVVSFCNSLGPFLGINMAQTIFASFLTRALDSKPQIDTATIIRAGPTSIGRTVPSELQTLVRDAYNYALTRAFVPSVICGGLAFCCSLAMEWGNVRKK